MDTSTQENLKIRSHLISLLIEYIRENQLTQVKAAELFDITQPRISDLMRNKVSLFSIDILINMLAKVGYEIDFNLTHPND